MKKNCSGGDKSGIGAENIIERLGMVYSAKRILVVTCLVLLNACVAGQTIDLNYTPSSSLRSLSQGSTEISVSVTDSRSFVRSGDKGQDYLAHYRAGLGNTWDVRTTGNKALASILSADLISDFSKTGLTVTTKDRSKREVAISIQDWNFDTYVNGRFWYEIRVDVLDASEKPIYRNLLKDTRIIDGSIWVGAKYAMEEAIPKFYSEIVQAITRDDPKLISAIVAP